MDKGLTTKMGTNSLAKIPQMPQNLSTQFVSPSPKALDFNEKRLHRASVVRVGVHQKILSNGSSHFITSSKI